MLFYLLLALVYLTTSIQCITTRYYELNITSTRYNADCSDHQSSVLMINNQLPGPPIYVNKGEQLEITVRNNILPNLPVFGGSGMKATIHFHGLRQFNSVQSDGVPFLTQKPIESNQFFVYKFIPDQCGTFFYHAHVGLQEMSVFGAIIIYCDSTADPLLRKGSALLQDGPFQYHNEHIVPISEWWHIDRGQFEAYYLGKNFTIIKEAESFLIHGQGIYNTGMDLDLECKGYHIIDVEPSKTYRLRIIGAMTFRTVGFSIAKHKMKVIEVDGEFIEPYEVDHLEVSPGQRFSVLIVTDNKEFNEFGIDIIRKWAAGVPTRTNGHAILKYYRDNKKNSFIPWITNKEEEEIPKGTRILSPSTIQPVFPVNDTVHWYWNDLKPYYDINPIVYKKSDRTIKLRGHQFKSSNNLTRWYINDISYMEHSQDVILHDILNKKRPLPKYEDINNSTGYNPILNTYPLYHLEIIDIVIQTTHPIGEPCRSHPWHTHGHSHWEIAYGEGEYVEERDGKIRNVPYPIFKDLTLVYPGKSEKKYTHSEEKEIGCGWSKIRIIADNPGIWAMHCHNSPHMYMGMMIALEESSHLISSSSFSS